MRAFVSCAAVLAALTSTAEAGRREKCATSIGATSGAAFRACMSAEKAASNSQKKPLYKDPRKSHVMQDGPLLICRGRASVGGDFHSS